jgi:hypothetical protein
MVKWNHNTNTWLGKSALSSWYQVNRMHVQFLEPIHSPIDLARHTIMRDKKAAGDKPK